MNDEELIAASTDPGSRRRGQLRLKLLRTQLEQRGQRSLLFSDPIYRQRMLERPDGERPKLGAAASRA